MATAGDGTERDDDGTILGPGASVEHLLAEHLPGLRAYVRLKAGPLVRSRERESDIVQSTCRQVLEQQARFRHGGPGHFRRWLYTTALRRILDKQDFHTAARRDARRDVGGLDAELLATYASFCTPSRVASAHELLGRIEAAFAELGDEQREVVLLSRIMGLSRAEVAEQMGRSEASVRNLLHRALARLSRELEA
jgi:RNA polymerase sigma factor (sigma-70 family)